MLERSSNGVTVRFLDGSKAVGLLRARAAALLSRDARVNRVLLFGSLAKGNYGARSDADLCVVLSEDPRPRWFDRIPDYLDAFLGCDIPVDVFIYTEAELDLMRRNGNALVRAIDRDAIVLGDRDRPALGAMSC